jgi:hypothetical protein
MHRVRNLDEDSQKSFWIDFNEKIKLILSIEFDNTNFFGEFNNRITSPDLQLFFNEQNSPENHNAEYHRAALIFDTTIDDLYNKQNSKKSAHKSTFNNNNPKIVSKSKNASKNSLNKIYMQNHNSIPNKIIMPIGRGSRSNAFNVHMSKKGGNNKTKRHKKTRSQKRYRRK